MTPPADRLRNLRLTDKDLHDADGVWPARDAADAQFTRVLEGLVEIAKDSRDKLGWAQSGFADSLINDLEQALEEGN